MGKFTEIDYKQFKHVYRRMYILKQSSLLDMLQDN